MREKKNQSQMANYLIDSRLQEKKDYPSELLPLLRAFTTREIGFTTTLKRRDKQIYQRQISLVERTFREYFLHTVQGISKILSGKPGKLETIQNASHIEKRAKRIKSIDPVHVNCIRRVNARLKYFAPQLVGDGEVAYRLEPFFLEIKKDPCGEAMLWSWLAVTIDSKEGLDPELVHECLYCKKTFFSKQRKKFHPECQSKYFSEKAVMEGDAKRRQKDYRERRKKKLRAKKKRMK